MRYSLIIILTLWRLASYSQDSSTIEFAQVYYNKAWRIIDKQGKFILNQEYGVGSYRSLCFGDKLAVVGVKTGKTVKYGYIDRTGKFVLKPVYNEANYFSYGLAPVKIGDKFGYIDRSGKIIIAAKFDNAFGFQREALGWTE